MPCCEPHAGTVRAARGVLVWISPLRCPSRVPGAQTVFLHRYVDVLDIGCGHGVLGLPGSMGVGQNVLQECT
jgi:hypothetical protein